jgi:PAS domain-containing protein
LKAKHFYAILIEEKIDKLQLMEITMDYCEIYKSVLDADRVAVVICDLKHNIIYMNPAAVNRYQKWGGKDLLGKSLLDCHNGKSKEMIIKVLEWFKQSEENQLVYTSYNEKENKDVYMVALRNDAGELIGYYEKHEYRNRETMKKYDLR